jgi:hypothetical protein
MSIRPVKRIIESKLTIEGAGVKLRRAFGFGETRALDPRSGLGQIEPRVSIRQCVQGQVPRASEGIE